MYTKPMYLDRKLIQDVPVHHDAINNADMYGIEVELEGRNIKSLTPEILKYWTVHNDGSLRNFKPGSECIEYVFNGPKSPDDTKLGLEVLFKHLNSPGVEVFDSYRTSIHVHLSFAQETYRTIFNMMVLSIIFDELLVSQSGKHRIGNNFCLRAKDAQGQISELVYSIENYGNFHHVSANNRYNSINFVSLMKFGTIEFRSLECTTDLQRVLNWVQTLGHIKAASREFDDPRHVIRKFNEVSSDEFLHSVLKDQSAEWAKVEGWERMLHDGMRLAQDLAFSSKWIRADKKENNPKKKPPMPPKKLKLSALSPVPAPGSSAAAAAQLHAYIQQHPSLAEYMPPTWGPMNVSQVHDEVQVDLETSYNTDF